MTPQLAAFLATVRHSEGTDLAADPWRCCYGYKHTIVDLSDHPALTGEWMGEALPDHLCIAMGLPLGTPSTAAGAYQINKHTWMRLRQLLTLPSFSDDCQNDAALEDIKSVGALGLINSGRIQEAFQACRIIWASLPGNPAHQPQRTMAELMAIYDKDYQAAA